MDPYGRPWRVERSLGQVGGVEVSCYETATGARLRLRDPQGREVFLDPLELEGLTRVRHKPVPGLGIASANGREDGQEAWHLRAESAQRLQNEFALVSVAVVQEKGRSGLLVRDMNGGLVVVLAPEEVEELLRVRHMDLARAPGGLGG
ncbi:MAG: hypothetical protein C4303_01290 [candidate division GAL15 bacterium]